MRGATALRAKTGQKLLRFVHSANKRQPFEEVIISPAPGQRSLRSVAAQHAFYVRPLRTFTMKQTTQASSGTEACRNVVRSGRDRVAILCCLYSAICSSVASMAEVTRLPVLQAFRVFGVLTLLSASAFRILSCLIGQVSAPEAHDFSSRCFLDLHSYQFEQLADATERLIEMPPNNRRSRSPRRHFGFLAKSLLNVLRARERLRLVYKKADRQLAMPRRY